MSIKEELKDVAEILLYVLILVIFLYFIEQKPLTRYSAEEYEAIYADR